ncbi:PREDICTED: COBRA-like protein 6 [Theobroma cacao]|uniref:COBRA-like protein 6 n=1 Tax=Theobroma cacao TaxID=3641 RepID=A0AB32WPF3_THECC|nr:PREDICTED: COBRA-like protein 6 [Theobroma cacao]
MVNFVSIVFWTTYFLVFLDGYDSLDPNGNIPIKWDSLAWDSSTYDYRKSRSSTPTCCLPMSEFYNETIVPCPLRNWSCQAQANCVKSGAKPSLLQQLRDKQQRLPPVLRCSSHMCPIQVHWHVNHIQNYSNGNLVVFHPSLTCIFSFNYNPLNYDGDIAMILGFFGGFSIITTSCCNQVRNGMCRLNCYCKKIQEFSPLGRMDFSKKDLF